MKKGNTSMRTTVMRKEGMTYYLVIWARNRTWTTRLTMIERGTGIDQEGVIETGMDVEEMKEGRLTIGTEIVGETEIVIGTEIEEGTEETGREVHTDHQMMTGTQTAVIAITGLIREKIERGRNG